MVIKIKYYKKNKIMCFHFFYAVQVDTVYKKGSLQLMLASVFTSWNLGNKWTYSAQVRLHCDLLEKIISV